ncbi:MAG TPA: DUF6230 family protein [Nocardioides sp.]|nr:DUF6230 family protein [Nocardioides sp.]
MTTRTTAWVPEGRTRWRRFSAASGVTLAMAGGLVYLTMSGALAVSFQISGIPFQLSASNLSGDGFLQYATVDPVSNAGSGAMLPDGSSQQSGGNTLDAATVTVLDDATITDLYQTICAPIPNMGFLPRNKLLVTIEAGSSEPVTAHNLIVDAPLMDAGTATFTNMKIGQDLGGARGGAADGNFAQTAQHVSIDDLHQVAIGTSAGQFKLTDLHVSARFVSSCP